MGRRGYPTEFRRREKPTHARHSAPRAPSRHRRARRPGLVRLRRGPRRVGSACAARWRPGRNSSRSGTARHGGRSTAGMCFVRATQLPGCPVRHPRHRQSSPASGSNGSTARDGTGSCGFRIPRLHRREATAQGGAALRCRFLRYPVVRWARIHVSCAASSTLAPVKVHTRPTRRWLGLVTQVGAPVQAASIGEEPTSGSP